MKKTLTAAVLLALAGIAGAQIVIPADAVSRMAALESGTSTWNQAASDAAGATGDVATLQGQVSDLESGTSLWNQASADGIQATGDVATLQGQVSDLESGTSLWNQASADGIQATGDVATLQGEMLSVQGRTSVWEKADTALQPGTITVTGITNAIDAGEITVGNTLASQTTMVGWWSATAGGAATAVGGFKAGANTVLLTETNSSTAVFTSHTDGTAILEVYVPAAGTRYFNTVQRDGAIKSSGAMVFDGP